MRRKVTMESLTSCVAVQLLSAETLRPEVAFYPQLSDSQPPTASLLLPKCTIPCFLCSLYYLRYFLFIFVGLWIFNRTSDLVKMNSTQMSFYLIHKLHIELFDLVNLQHLKIQPRTLRSIINLLRIMRHY